MRLNNSLNKKALIKVADSLFNSKIRYGLQLLGKVRMSTNESQNQLLQDIQLAQNKLIRFLNNKRISDKISTETLTIENLFAQVDLFSFGADLKIFVEQFNEMLLYLTEL